MFIGTAFEHSNKIIVAKKDTFNYLDDSTTEYFEFTTISEYEDWKANQEWINSINAISPFKKVKKGR